VNPSDANQIQAFTESAMRPAFDKLKTLLDIPGQRITIAHSADTGKPAVNNLLHQMHPDTPYLDIKPSHRSLSEDSSLSTQSWICGSLVVEILQHLDSDAIYVSQYGLSIELKIPPLRRIQVTSIIGFTKPEQEAPEILHLRFEEDHQPLNIEEIDRADITLRFIEHFRTFEAQVLNATIILEETPEPSNPIETALFNKAHPSPIPETIVSPVPTPQPLSYEETKAAREKIQTAQKQAIEPLLNYLKQSQKTFRNIWPSDLAHGAALAQKIIKAHPAPESDYQQAYDLLSHQAIEFAWSLKPNMLAEFADYFEVYWTMAERASTFTSIQENRPYPETFVAQVHALGEPENPAQVKATVSQELRSLVRSIGLKFGRPDEVGKRDWIGVGTMHSTEPVKRMPEMIQTLNEQRRVLFDPLSWGILQVYQNAEQLPPVEQRLGRNLVLSYLISARLTIKKTTQAVECDPSNLDYYEFQFKRRIEDGSHAWIATAWVQVSRLRCVNLYRYGFEAC
jgi:hypothetical protein